ncbi:HTH-type transcriptional regulator HmrR [bacterium YEK0313]|nr:HTH-type transcriptional regulator HmrR [bacterium YEK0313]
MRPSPTFFGPADAARRLGVSVKALRIYERHGLVAPGRTASGWRSYGPDDMARLAEIAALRALGLSLGQVARVLAGEPRDLEPALAAHQARLEAEAGALSAVLGRVRAIRAGLAQGHSPVIGELARLLGPATAEALAFDLPWPWGGERFVLRDIKALTYIIGPRGSGKTRLAQRIADALPGAVFVDLDRAADGAAAARMRIAANPALAARVETALAWLAEDGAAPSDALLALIAALEARESAFMVVDMVEQGLDQPSQEALIAHLRRRGPDRRPLFLMTRSNAILDLAAVGADEAIIFCPANHSPPTLVAPHPGAPGYEAVATCLASPDVRARLGAA